MFIRRVVTGIPIVTLRRPFSRSRCAPVLSAEQARHLLRSLPDTTLAGLRDRALIATMLYTFARISAALAVDVHDMHH